MPQEINWSAKAQVLEAVTSNGENLEFADYSLRSDREVVMAAVTGYQGGYGRALLFASESLRNDIEIVRVAVSSRGCTLEFASKELKADPEIVMLAVMNDGIALTYADHRFRSDRSVAATAITYTNYRNVHDIWSIISDNLKNNIDFLRSACRSNLKFADALSPTQRGALGLLLEQTVSVRFNMLLSTVVLFNNDDDEWWSQYEFDKGRLRVRCEARMGAGGIEGSMGLWIPPSGHDVDAWEASRNAGEHDWWAFLGFLTAPSGKADAPPKLMIFHEESTFFNESRWVIKIIDLLDSESSNITSVACYSSDCASDLYSAYLQLSDIFRTHLDAEVSDVGARFDWL